MKISFLLPLLLVFVSSVFAQKNLSPTAEKDPPPIDPTQLVDFEPPTILCLNVLNINIMPTGMIQLWASDILQHVIDNATPVGQIQIGVRKAGTGTGFPFDNQMPTQPNTSVTLICDGIGTNVSLELWAMDASGNTAFCTTTVIINNCDGGNNINLFLCAKTMCGGEAIETAVFNIDGTSNFAPPYSYFDLTDANGCSEIFNSVPLDATFTIRPEKDDNPTNGMDEQDFTLLSKHINGSQPFTEPWQWVAADANKDGLITLEDSIEFRNLMLGIYTELPNNSGWRFVAGNYQFPSPNPLSQPFPEFISIADAMTDMDTSFLGIKIGDLDCSASPQLTSDPSKERNNLSAQEKGFPTPDPTQLGDFEPPSVVCLNGLSVNLMPTGAINLWDSDFLQYTFDNATPVNQIQIGIRKEGAGTGFPMEVSGNPTHNVLFNCDELGIQTIELWAKDLAGNTAFCLTPILVSDNLHNCNNPTKDWLIEVCAKTEIIDGVEEAEYEVYGNNPNGPFFVTDLTNQYDNGCGYFDVPLGSNVSVAPIKDDNPLNGVTTYDLVLIDKHIRGIELLNTPYKMIAADADRNGVIDSADIEEIRNVIIGIYTEFPNNTSWRFVPKDFVFPDPLNPLSEFFPESVTVQNIQVQVSAEFVGIKIGDVNNTSVANAASPILDERNAPATVSLGLPRPNPTDGVATLPIQLPNAENLRLEISDLAGKLLWVNDLQLEKGNHTLEIPASALPIAGVYVWRVRAGGVVGAGKLVRQ